ncbi:hypothetical protein Tco_0532709 [Tanacetum coccineum]
MDTTRAQQQALDDELVAPADRLKIGKSNLRLSSILKSKEPTLQVALDALKLTPFYNAFEISADVPEIYMQEFWVTVSRHHSSLRFKLNGKSHTVNVDNFRDMLKICPKLPGQIFEEPPLEEEILSFIRDLGHTAFMMNRLEVDTLTPELLAGPTFKLMKGSCKSLESARDVYSKRSIIAVTKLEIVEWHNYKHLDWITVRRDDDKLYKFKEDNFNRLRIQDIEDILLLLV